MQHGTANEENIKPVKYVTTINIYCYNCNKLGNLSSNWTEPDHHQNGGKYGNVFLQIRYGFTQNEKDSIPKTWLLLDICFTASIVNNDELFSNIQDFTYENALTIITNGGSQKFSKLAPLKISTLDIHFNPDSMENILSFKEFLNPRSMYNYGYWYIDISYCPQQQ